MADHGDILTRFEELFGTFTEHDVIKLALQTCEWDPKAAITMLLDMTDPKDLTPQLMDILSTGLLFDTDLCKNIVTPQQNYNISNSYNSSTSSSSNNGSCENLIDFDDIEAAAFSGIAVTSVPSTKQKDPSLVFSQPLPTQEQKETPLNPLASPWTPNDYTHHTLTNIPGAAFYGRNAQIQQMLSPHQEPSISEHKSIKPKDIPIIKNIPESQNAQQIDPITATTESEAETTQDQIIKIIDSNPRVMVLLRGLPGSGKSTLANKINKVGGVILSTDDFFLDANGIYIYDISRLSDAHTWNQRRTVKHLKRNKSPIIIDNTNVKSWEMMPYIKLALEYKYIIKVLEPDTTWKYNPNILSKTNMHGVPREKIKKMLENFDKINLNFIIKKIDPSYSEENVNNQDNEIGAATPSFQNSFISNDLNDSKNISQQKESIDTQEAEEIIEETNPPSESDISECDTKNSNGGSDSPDVIIEDDFIQNELSKESHNVMPSNNNSDNVPNIIEKTDFESIVQHMGSVLQSQMEGKQTESLEKIRESDNNEYTNDEDVSKYLSKVGEDLGHELNGLSIGELQKLTEAKVIESTNLLEGETSESTVQNGLTQIQEGYKDIEWGSEIKHNDTNWENIEEKPSIDTPQEHRTNARMRRKPGDPNKWVDEMKNKEDDLLQNKFLSMWKSSETPGAWDENTNEKCMKDTGAVPKQRRDVRSSPKSFISTKESLTTSKATQVCFGENLPENSNILIGEPNRFITGAKSVSASQIDPIVNGKLLLEKGIMTDEQYLKQHLNKKHDQLIQNIVSLFPDLRKEDLQDVLEKCNYDLDWATNVLLDGGYSMSDTFSNTTEDISDADSPQHVQSSHIESSSISPEQKEVSTKSTEQLKKPREKKVFKKKIDLENSFQLPQTVDDRVKRITGKNYEDLYSSEIKKKKKEKSSKKSKKAEKERIDDSSTNAQYLTLVMDPIFSLHLKQMYGSPLSTMDFSCDSPVENSVILPLSLCQEIHKYWKSSLEGKFTHEADIIDRIIREDEELARTLQNEEDRQSSPTAILDSDNFEKDPPMNLQEIMDLETALQDSNKDLFDTSLSTSAKLTLNKLVQEFSFVDPSAVETLFRKCKQSYNDSVVNLIAKYGTEQDQPKSVFSSEQAEIAIREQEATIRKEMEKQWEEEDILPDDPQVYRDEAEMHYRQRKKYYEKAQQASSNGMRAVAAFYARMGNNHTIKMQEANERASEKILEHRNCHQDPNRLDLHLLHIPEALKATQLFLSERKQVLLSKGIQSVKIYIVTGRGAHSHNNRPKLKPAIRDFLKMEGYSFCEANSGCFEVTVTK